MAVIVNSGTLNDISIQQYVHEKSTSKLKAQVRPPDNAVRVFYSSLHVSATADPHRVSYRNIY